MRRQSRTPSSRRAARAPVRSEGPLPHSGLWARVDGRRELGALAEKAEALPRGGDALRYAICARESVDHAGDALVSTAADMFGA